jgi:hypothetical protein
MFTAPTSGDAGRFVIRRIKKWEVRSGKCKGMDGNGWIGKRLF